MRGVDVLDMVRRRNGDVYDMTELGDAAGPAHLER
jgi:hypothetical protein